MTTRKPIQQCAICGARQSLSTRKCSICGAVLPGHPTSLVPLPRINEERQKPKVPTLQYDSSVGEDDLYAGDLGGRAGRYVLIAAVCAALIIGLGIGVVLTGLGSGDASGSKEPQEAALLQAGTERPTVPPTATPRGSTPAAPSATRYPTMAFVTVTPAPPTETDTPEPGPCIQVAQQGDTVYGMAIRCGHLDMAVVDLILQMNNLSSANQLQLGQQLTIPWPTVTPGGPVTEAPAPDGNSDSGLFVTATPGVIYNEFGTPNSLAMYQSVEPTLRPGQAWHTVVLGETIDSIVLDYSLPDAPVTVEMLSQINPEVAFLQCDYGLQLGGPNCSVMLYEGQQIRVPVPLPTQTPTPSPVGTLTPTPTGTATFNAPFADSPADKAHYNADQMVTLRWGATGSLNGGERYIVRVIDQTNGDQHLAAVTDTMYVLPGGWQPSDREEHTFEWTISVGRIDAQNNVVSEQHITQPRTFTWDSR